MVNGRIPSFSEFVAVKIRSGWKPPMPDPYGGGGGVTANDILAQRGPVVTGPPLAPAPDYDPFLAQTMAFHGQAAAGEVYPQPPQADLATQLMGRRLVSEARAGLPQLQAGYVNPAMRPYFEPEGPRAGLSGPLYPVPTLPPGPVTPTPLDPNAPPPGLSFDPEEMYASYVEGGMDKDQARLRVNEAVPREQMMGANTTTGRDPNATGGLLDAIPGPTADQIMNAPREVIENAQAEGIYANIIKYRKDGIDDRTILTTVLKSPMNAFMVNVPVGPNDDDATITKFFDGLVNAYEHGFSPKRKVLTNIGTYTEEYLAQPPTMAEAIEKGDLPKEATPADYDAYRLNWRQFGPGAKAAHEYLAGEGNPIERGAGTIFLDPTSYLGLEKGLGEGLIATGERIGARETGSIAVKGWGATLKGAGYATMAPNAVLNWIPDT
jgi:hypothetical protein